MQGQNVGQDGYSYTHNPMSFYHRREYPWGYNPDQVANMNRHWVGTQWRRQKAAFDANRNATNRNPNTPRVTNYDRDLSVFIYRPPENDFPVVLPTITPASQATGLCHCTPCVRRGDRWPANPPPLLPLRTRPRILFVDPNAPVVLPPWTPVPRARRNTPPRQLRRRRRPTLSEQLPPPLPQSFRTNFKKKTRSTPYGQLRSWLDKHFSRPKLNPLLAYIPHKSPISCDLRCNRPYMAAISHLQRRILDLSESFLPATDPPVRFMRLYHPLLPWYIEITSTDSSGITIYELLSVLMQQLSYQVTSKEFYSKWITGAEREAIWKAALKRSGTSEIRRVDFLMNQTMFNGLEKGERGAWKIHTSHN